MRSLAEPTPKVVVAAGLALGIAAIVAGSMIPEKWPPPPYMASMAAVFGVVAAFGAAFLKRRPSTVGVLVAAPMTVLLLISVLFAGNLVAFVRHDVLILVGAISGAFLGAHLGTRLFRRSESEA